MILYLAARSAERDDTAALLAARGYAVSTAEPSALHARGVRADTRAIILDLASTGGLKVLRRSGVRAGRVPVICLAHPHQGELAAEALRLGAVDIVPRPVHGDELLAAIANARELSGASDAIERSTMPAGSDEDVVFGVSPAMCGIARLVGPVATSRCAVLIVGECGTGRETIARTIHAQGPRSARPFVKVSCGSASAAALSHALGAADGATVYLEDVAELTLDLQAQLEEQLRVRRRTAGRPERRIVAATRPRVMEWIERGTVRRGLVDALSVVRIDVPPLRARPEDVPLLAVHFLKRACRENGTPLKTFSQNALLLLAALPWRGNAAELRAVCERIALLAPRGGVALEDVLAHVRFDGAETIGHSESTLREARERFERDYLLVTLQRHRGRMGAAARQLGIERTNLYRKMKHLNIPRVRASD